MKKVTIQKGSKVFNIQTGRVITSKKDFVVDVHCFKAGSVYYKVKGDIYRTLQGNIKERA